MSHSIQTQQDVEQYLQTMRLLNESTDDYLFLWDLQQKRIYIFGGIHEKFDLGSSPEEGHTLEDWTSVVYSRDLPAVSEHLNLIMEGRETVHNMEYRLVDRKGNRIWISCRGKAQFDTDGRQLCMIGRISDKALEKKADPLTGLLNGEKLIEDMEASLSNERNGCLMVLGIDNFKDINIKYGRGYGNHILKRVSEALENSTDPLSHIYRLDGDRFAIYMPEAACVQAKTVFFKIREHLQEYCTLSAGVVAFDAAPSADENTLYQYGETALDRAKKNGKDTFVFFQQEDYEQQRSRIELLDELRRSVQNQFSGFSLCYQPQIRSGSFELWGAEALLRYTSPKNGPVGPDVFIPLLEQTELICQVGLWVLKTALEQCLAWRQRIPSFHMSVNISYVQLRQEGIADQILKVLESVGLPGDALTLEVTESMQLQDYRHFNKIFYQWERCGIQIAIDDFGTGYSSLSYLKSMEIHEIKIDRCFVCHIQHSAYNYRLLSNMIELAHSAQIRVCCEGVETKEELEVLAGLSPEMLQGYLFAKPCPRDLFEALYMDENTELYQNREEAVRCFQTQFGAPGGNEAESIGREELSAIVEGMDDVVYVSDVETFELYYLNPAGRRLTGMYDYKGHKCYEVLQGQSHPCEFCTNHCLRMDQFHVWENENPFLKRHFILKDKRILWCGKMARLEIAIDITEKEIVSQNVREKLDFEKNIVDCTRMLVEEEHIGTAIFKVLGSIGEFYQADRAYVFEIDEDGGHWSNSYEWCREGIDSQKDRLQAVPSKLLRRWIHSFEQEKSIVITDVDQVQEEFYAEWNVLSSQGIKNLLAVPIWKERRLIGFIGVDNPRYRREDDAQLHTMACFLADRVTRYQTEERLNELLDCRYEDILKSTALGLWVIRLDPEQGQAQMYTDGTMRRLLGIHTSLTPEECYQQWYGRINDGYYHYVNASVDSMIKTRQITQLEYTWDHPDKGEVVVRCLGIRAEDSDGMICLQGYHRIISEMDKPKFIHEAATSEMFEFNEMKKSIYFHTGRELLAGDCLKEEDFPECWIRKDMVHPNFVDQFRSMFLDVGQQEENQGMEILLKTKHGAYEWFKLRIRHLGKEAQDVNTIVVRLDAANQERTLELEYMRKNDFYEAMLSETVAYAEVDVEENQLKASGGLWASYMEESRQWGETFTEVMVRHIRELVPPEEIGICEPYMQVETMRALHKEDTHTAKVCVRRLMKGEYHWMELVVHVFQERFTEKMHALLYLKDVDVEKRRALAQEQEASRDPLTNVYNRRTFEREVKLHMSSREESYGAIIVIDLDNFKQINDTYGHLEGDAALKRLTEILLATFRRRDLIGRLGGDEFLVFLKDVSSREILDRRMAQLFEALGKENPVPISCSAGIAMVEKGEFSYEKSLERADQALYRSKGCGKNQYCYYEE